MTLGCWKCIDEYVIALQSIVLTLAVASNQHDLRVPGEILLAEQSKKFLVTKSMNDLAFQLLWSTQ